MAPSSAPVAATVTTLTLYAPSRFVAVSALIVGSVVAPFANGRQ